MQPHQVAYALAHAPIEPDVLGGLPQFCANAAELNDNTKAERRIVPKTFFIAISPPAPGKSVRCCFQFAANLFV
jgi:hypothetical protein